jgi:hypothetical protein
VNAAAANCFHMQPETELGGNLIGVLREYRQRTAADVADADNADIYIAHS